MQKSLSFKNSTISFSDVGKGPAVVLLHGFLENSTMWKDVVPELTETKRVVTIDLLGHGQTDCLGYVHSMEIMAEAVYAVLKSLRLRKVIVVGHSMGGYVALALAEQHPKMIKGLCLMNSTSYADDEERKQLRARANKMVQNNFENMVRMSFTNLFEEVSRTLFKQEIELALAEALKTPVQGYIASQEGMRIRPDRSHVLEKSTFPSFYIIASEDPVIDAISNNKEAIKVGAKIYGIEGGHMSHIENKELLVGGLCGCISYINNFSSSKKEN